jgi:hypothetical protein
MSIPDTDMHIGDLYEETLEKYSSGQLKKDGLMLNHYFKSDFNTL